MPEEMDDMDLTNEPTVDIFNCADTVESAIVQDALREAGIRFLLRPDQEDDPLGFLSGEHGEGIISVLEEDADRAIEVIQSALPDETELEEDEEDGEEEEEEDEDDELA